LPSNDRSNTWCIFPLSLSDLVTASAIFESTFIAFVGLPLPKLKYLPGLKEARWLVFLAWLCSPISPTTVLRYPMRYDAKLILAGSIKFC